MIGHIKKRDKEVSKVYSEKSVVFIGHSECYDISLQLLQEKITDCVIEGYTFFMSGGQGSFDRLSATAVYNVKQHFPHIKNILVNSAKNKAKL